MAKRAQIEAVERLVRETVAQVDALAPDAARAVLPALRAARDELQSDLAEWMARVDGADRFTVLEKRKALRALESAIERLGELHPAMTRALGITRARVAPLAIENLDTEIVRLGQIFGDRTLAVPAIDTAATLARGDRLLWKRHARSAARYAGAVGDDIRHLLAVGVAKRETFEQLVSRLRRLNGGPRAGIDNAAPGAIADGLFQRYKHWADRLVRTEMMHAYNVQHSEAIEAVNESRPEGEDEYMRRWDAAADVVTCPLCKELDRMLATMRGTFRYGIVAPPAHPYCRCVVLAWLARWGGFKGETPHLGELPSKPPPPIEKPASDDAAEPKKNPKRVAAARKAAEASVERRREIHSAVASNLPEDLQVAWEKEGHKFMREQASSIRGIKDRVSAASKLSEKFAETYGSGEQSVIGNEGDRFYRRAEIEAKHATQWADEQERKYYEAARKEALHNGEIDEHGELLKPGRSQHVDWKPKSDDDDDPPF